MVYPFLALPAAKDSFTGDSHELAQLPIKGTARARLARELKLQQLNLDQAQTAINSGHSCTFKNTKTHASLLK